MYQKIIDYRTLLYDQRKRMEMPTEEKRAKDNEAGYLRLGSRSFYSDKFRTALVCRLLPANKAKSWSSLGTEWLRRKYSKRIQNTTTKCSSFTGTRAMTPSQRDYRKVCTAGDLVRLNERPRKKETKDESKNGPVKENAAKSALICSAADTYSYQVQVKKIPRNTVKTGFKETVKMTIMVVYSRNMAGLKKF